MLQVFFPSGLRYKDESIKYNVHKKFWKRAYHVHKIRRQAEERRRCARRKDQGVDQGHKMV
jgi:hypothetical protein